MRTVCGDSKDQADSLLPLLSGSIFGTGKRGILEMLMTVVGIEKTGDDTARIAFVGNTNGTNFTTQLFLMVPWADRKIYQLDGRYWMGINIHEAQLEAK